MRILRVQAPPGVLFCKFRNFLLPVFSVFCQKLPPAFVVHWQNTCLLCVFRRFKLRKVHDCASSKLFCSLYFQFLPVVATAASLYFQFLPDAVTDACSSVVEHLPVVPVTRVQTPPSALFCKFRNFLLRLCQLLPPTLVVHWQNTCLLCAPCMCCIP